MKPFVLSFSSLTIILLFIASAYPEQDHIEAFFQHLTQDGGTWVATNPGAKDPADFSHFLMEFNPDGKYSVRGTIRAINSTGDTTRIWDIWEFPDPSRQNTTVLVQRSSWAYGIGTSTFSADDHREGELELTMYNATTLQHRDNHRFVGRDTLISSSADYDEALKEWKTPTQLTWVRQKQ